MADDEPEGFTLHDVPPGEKPRLFHDPYDPDVTVGKLRDILAGSGTLFDRGVPVRLAHDRHQGGTIAQPITPELLIMEAHRICRPYELREKKGDMVEVKARLSRQIATMYLEWRGEWRLKPLHGIACAPLLHGDGSIHYAEGYDDASGMWCENVPDLAGLVPDDPTKDDAQQALLLLRRMFATFCFADADRAYDQSCGVPLVDVTKPPGKDESGFLTALLTAVCRPSLDLAPGVLLRAAPMSGAGAGKGLLARCICMIAFGRQPHAVTAGGNAEELEKRISAELIEGSPTLFVDNLNSIAFRSELLASAITERPARVRVLGKSLMVPLCATAFIVLTGNGLTVSEDLARRFLTIELDPGTEDPEARPFRGDIRAEVKARRTELLVACLTIWRWGRQADNVEPGRALGSFGQWCSWVRDPLLALGCQDPAERISESKARDGSRQAVAELFIAWWHHHKSEPVTAKDLHGDVRLLVDPQRRGRQFLAAVLEKLVGTRMAGFALSRQASPGKWGAATYALQNLSETEEHRGHGGHRADNTAASASSGTSDADGPSTLAPMPPMPPMPLSNSDELVDEVVLWPLRSCFVA
jgi:hypothetical protein